MSIKDILSGYVLQPTRNATSNATDTASAINGVLRDISEIPLQHVNLFGEILSSQYRCAYLEQPYGLEEEYLIWAANNSNLALVEDSSWIQDSANLFFASENATFTNEIGTEYSSTNQIYIEDSESRSIAGVESIFIRRGDSTELGLPIVPIELLVDTHFTYSFGVITLNATGLALLGGGLSEQRQDFLQGANYFLERARFWWSRNDSQKTRFKWDDKESRWKPLKGQGVISLGKLLPNETYELTPKLTDLKVGDFLKGDFSDSTKKALLRLGTNPSESALVVRAKVVEDELIKDDYDFVGDTDNPDAIVGKQENKILFNPEYVLANAGNTLWYSFPKFSENSNGIVGDLKAESHFLCPIPTIFDRPMVRIGSRKHLIAIPVLNETELDSLVIPNEKSFGWCAGTGKLKFHQGLLDKADDETDGFDINYLGAQVIYDGVSLNQLPLETATPAEMPSQGEYYEIPFSEQGALRKSGLLKTPDGTGLTPTSTTSVSPRPQEGLLIDLFGVGDTIFFGKTFACENIVVENREEDLPFEWFRKKNVAYVALDTQRVFLSKKTKKELGEDSLYFAQGDMTPARTMTNCRIPSRRSLEYTVRFGDVFVFALKDSSGTLNTYSWVCSTSGTFSAQDMADVLNNETGLLASGDGFFSVIDEYLCIETSSLTGRIEIGFGTTSAYSDRDLSGCASLGFNAGWVVDTTQEIFLLNDSGFSFGMYRNPKNKAQKKPLSDFKQVRELETSIGAPSTLYQQNLDKIPLEDEIGFEPNVFFRWQLGIIEIALRNYDKIVHNFGEENFIWCAYTNMPATQILKETTIASLIPPLLPNAMTPKLNTGIYLSENGTETTLLKKDEEYLLRDGLQGIVEFIDIQNELLLEGVQGQCSGNTFTDGSFLGVAIGNRLKILSGENEGSYYISEASPSYLKVEPAFLSNVSNVSWEIYEGIDKDSYDPSLVCDKLFVPVSHLSEEPFKVRVITQLGSVAGSSQIFSFEGGEILENNRKIYAQIGAVSHELLVLERYQIGKVENNSLVIEEDSFLQQEAFSLSLGNTEFSVDIGNISLVSAFSEPVLDGIIEIGEYGSSIAGQVEFSQTVLDAFGAQQVLYQQKFLNTTDFQVNTNQVFVPNGHEGLVELVEEMVTNIDVTISPITGTIAFNEVLKKNKQVEVEYFLANVDGSLLEDENGAPTQIITRLPVSYKLQATTQLTETEFAFNAEGRTLDRDATIRIWRGNQLMNINGNIDAVVDYDNNLIVFELPVDSSVEVLINYFAYESSGNERSYQLARFPVWRPPFRLEENVSQFMVTGDQTNSFTQGKLILVDGACFYATGSTHLNGFTTVSFYPTTTQEHGSNAPASDQGLFLTDRDLNENDGFWFDVPHIQFENVDKGMNKIVLEGNHFDLLTINHVFELSGDPYLVESVKLSDDGSYTIVSFQAPFVTAYERSEDTLRVSTRPIYFENGTDFLVKPFVVDQPYELILGGTRQNGVELPARTLIEDVEFKINADTGVITFNTLFLSGIKSGESLYFYSVVRRTLSPKIDMGNFIIPVVRGRYLSAITPKREGSVLAKYKFFAPDSFYSRVVPNTIQMGEIADNFSNSMRTSHSGSASLFAFDTNNNTKGSLDERGKLQEALRKDQAARLFIDLYNEIIRGFEQVKETVIGGFVGDRDGKFKFFVGRNEDFTPFGYEDPFSGIYNPRNTWNIYFNNRRKSLGLSRIILLEEDSIISPESASLVDLILEGDFTDLDELNEFIEKQKKYVRNDIDDRVLVGRKRFRLFPRRSEGEYNYMGEAHSLSRLYPERTISFTRLFSGTLEKVYGEGGVFTAGRVYDEKSYRTRNSQNGSIENPALGVIKNISSLEVFKRLPRARIVDFSPNGFPDIDNTLGTSIGERPVLIATPLLVKDFPIDNLGIPDIARLIVGGGELVDLTTGDYDLSTPAFEAGQQIGFGYPNGELVPIVTSAGTGVYVKEILEGCIITFADNQGTDILSMEEMLSALTQQQIDLKSGDTIMGVTETSFVDSSGAPVDEITDFEQQSLLQSNNDLIDWFHLGRNLKKGEYIDKTLLTEDDSDLGAFFDLQKWLGQVPPQPLQTIEALVEFSNTRTTPVILPCLKGEEKDDTGDYAIPYLRGGETELSILGEVATEFEKLLDFDNYDTTSSVYPNERIGNDGVLSVRGLETSIDLTPIATAGAYTPHTGLGDLREGDFVLVETDSSDPQSWRGIHSVGYMDTGLIQFPRVVSRTFAGSTIKYDLTNFAVHFATATDGLGNSLNGLVVLDDGADTTFDISSISGFQLSGWLNFLNTPIEPVTGGNRNAIEIKIIEHTTGLVVETITIYHDLNPTVSWDRYLFSANIGGASPIVNMTIDPTEEIITFVGLTGWFDFASLGLPIGGDPNKFFDFAINIYANEDPFTNTTEYNGDNLTHYPNRCQITGEFDYRKAGVGQEHPNSGTAFPTRLDTREISFFSNLLDINSVSQINGGVPFVITEELVAQNTITLPNQGQGNIELVGSNIRFSGLASSTKSETSDISSGVGFCYDGLEAIIGDYATLVSGTPLAPTNGAISNVQKGDVVYISNGFDTTTTTQTPAVKTGTYLVKHAIENDAGQFYQQKNPTYQAGSTGLGVKTTFPKVKTLTSSELVLRDVHSVPSSPTGNSFASSGVVYVLETAPIKITYTSQTDLGDGLVSFVVTSIVYVSGITYFGVLDALVGIACSGMSYLPIEWEYDNVVGYDDGAGTYLGGFLSIDISGTSFVVSGAILDAGGGNEIGVHIPAKISSENFDANPKAVVYDNVATYVDISNVDWAVVNTFEWLDKTDTLTIDFYALGGIFFEPSIPLSSQDLNGTEEKVVDATHSLSTIGMRNNPHQTYEEIEFVVSRIRRWNNSTLAIDETIKRLPYVYETRRGEILVGTTEDTLVTNGTQLGGFTEELVNVNFGDTIRILNAQGDVVEEVIIEAVVSDTELAIEAPHIRNSLVLASPSDFTFEIYLRTPMIPLEQSHEELKDMMTDTIIVRSSTGKVRTRNVLEDDNQDFVNLQENDILIIDPQGLQNLEDERGTRPFGDKGVSSRAEFIGGSPSELDDNRGFYRVVEVIDGKVSVSPIHTFAGTADDPEIFGANLTSQEYVVLPTISTMGVDGEPEAQNDLRPTQVADGLGSFKGNLYSLEPFSYIIVRPTGLFSEDMQDFTLFHRERILSWIEELRVPMLNAKSGLYHDFQKDEHISELNDPTETDIGVGVFSNETLFSLSGETSVAPFLNTSDCVSVLDRRHWCQDTRLDYLTPYGSVNPYTSIEREIVGYITGSGRALMIDRIDEILDYSDRLRDLRYTWINFRTNLSNGTLREAQFAEEILERNLSEQEVLLIIEESMEKL